MKITRRIFCLIFFLLILISSQAQTVDLKSRVELTILHTNDNHGHLEPFDMVGQKKVGGMAPRMTLIKEIREDVTQKNGCLLLLDSGDINTGDPTSDMLFAEPDVLLMNKMGYQAMAVGNHEFDLPLDKLFDQQKKAHFPYLSANVFYRSTGKPVFQETLLLSCKGLRIGLFGITPPDTPLISTCGNNPDIYFEQPERVIPQILEEFKDKVDFIIGLFHLDHGHAVKIAKLFPQIDIIIGGHTHLPTLTPKKIGKTLIAEAGCYGLMVGKFDLTFENRKLVDWKYEMIGINLTQRVLDGAGNIGCLPFKKTFPNDPEVVQFLAPYLAETEKLLSKPIGKTLEDIEADKSLIQFYSSPLGNLICDAIREEAHLDIALQNTGGIRTDLLKGEITPKAILKILPFTNTIIVYTLTGKEVREIFLDMVSGQVTSKGLLEASGINLEIKDKKPVNIKIGGKPLDENALYRVGINSFIAKGGDGYTVFSKFSNGIDTGLYLSSVLQSYIHKHSPLIAFKEKRIIWEETNSGNERKKKYGIR